jgi:ribosome maturation factor RimP
LQEVGLQAHFFLDLRQNSTTKNPGIEASSLQEEIEARLSMLEPDVEVLLVEQIGGAGLRVFLDRPGGVDHELCVRTTRHLRDLLRDYTIEVSSPGPSRPLTKPDHFRRFVGRRVRVRTREAVEGRSEFRGELVEADGRGVALAGEWGTVTIPHERIRRSNLIPERSTGPGGAGAGERKP